MEIVHERSGYSFEINAGIIVSVSFGSRKVSLGDEVMITEPYAKRLGLDQAGIGKVMVIYRPDTNGLTTNIIGVDFMNCGLPTSQLKIHEVVATLALRS